MSQTECPHFSTQEIEGTAARIEVRAARGRIVQLLPGTAMLAASGLRLKAWPPQRV